MCLLINNANVDNNGVRPCTCICFILEIMLYMNVYNVCQCAWGHMWGYESQLVLKPCKGCVLCFFLSTAECSGAVTGYDIW